MMMDGARVSGKRRDGGALGLRRRRRASWKCLEPEEVALVMMLGRLSPLEAIGRLHALPAAKRRLLCELWSVRPGQHRWSSEVHAHCARVVSHVIPLDGLLGDGDGNGGTRTTVGENAIAVGRGGRA